MQPITPLVAADFHAPVQSMRQKFEIFVDGFWVDVTGYEPVPVPEPPAYNFDLIIQDMAHAHTAENITWAGEYIYADSPELEDVQAAIDLASPGDTVCIPAGTGTWGNNRLDTITKSLLIIGAGSGQTIINATWNQGGGSVEDAYNVVSFHPSNPSANPYFRLAHMTIRNIGGSGGVLLLSNSTSYDCTNIRLDHLNLVHTGWVFQHVGLMHGVMDNCSITGCMDIAGPYTLWTTNGYEHGTISNMYIEDSTWGAYSGSNEIYHAGNGAARYAMRHCTINLPSTAAISPLFDQHGNQGGNGTPGYGAYACFGAEIYENTLNLGANDHSMLMFDQRGGKSLVYNNTVTRTGSGGATLRVKEEWQDSTCPPAVNAINGQPQHPSDSYYWGNRKWGIQFDPELSPELGAVCSTCGLVVPTENVHVWMEKSSFNGSVGIGVGLLSARPATCTVGVGYWATDESKLYRCTSTNVWTLYYTPYTYPHPHRSDPILGD